VVLLPWVILFYMSIRELPAGKMTDKHLVSATNWETSHPKQLQSWAKMHMLLVVQCNFFCKHLIS